MREYGRRVVMVEGESEEVGKGPRGTRGGCSLGTPKVNHNVCQDAATLYHRVVQAAWAEPCKMLIDVVGVSKQLNGPTFVAQVEVDVTV